jgi:hypothetical protein
MGILTSRKRGCLYFMHKHHPELGLFLAERALEMKYADTAAKITERAELKKFCIDNFSTQNVKRLYFRLQKVELNRIIVDTVLQGLSSSKRTFIIMKYKHHKTFTNISLTLEISASQLNVWNKCVLQEIRNLMFYKITTQDVFNKIKIINMIHIIDIRISFFEEYMRMSPEEMSFVNKNWLNNLMSYRQKYRDLLIFLEDNAYENPIIALKIEFPHLTASKLANKCHIDLSTVSRMLKQFMCKAQNFIC